MARTFDEILMLKLTVAAGGRLVSLKTERGEYQVVLTSDVIPERSISTRLERDGLLMPVDMLKDRIMAPLVSALESVEFPARHDRYVIASRELAEIYAQSYVVTA